MSMFNYKNYSSEQSAEMLITAHRIAAFDNAAGAFGAPYALLDAGQNLINTTSFYPNEMNAALPDGWRAITPTELSLPNSALDYSGHYTFSSPLTGNLPSGPQLTIAGEYDTSGKLTRVAVSMTGTNSPIDVADYFLLNSGGVVPAMDPILTTVKNFVTSQGLTAEDVIITGFSLGGALANLIAKNRITLADGFFENANFMAFEAPLIYDNPNVIFNYGYENDAVYRGLGDNTLFQAIQDSGLTLTPPDKNFASTIDNVVLFDDVYASPLWPLPVFSIANPFSWYAHLDAVFTDATQRIADNPFYEYMEKDSTVVVANLTELSRNTTWVRDKESATSSHFGAPAFVIGSKYNDLLEGGIGGDYIYGDAGNDIIRTGGAGADRVDGGSGINELRLSGSASDWNAYRLSDGTLIMDAKNQTNLVEAEHIQRVSFENDGLSQLNPYIVGNAALQDKRAGFFSWLHSENATYSSMTEGTDSNDLLLGKTVFGKNGNDKLNALTSGSLLHGGEGQDTLNGNTGNDRLYGAEGNDILMGGKGKDTLNGGVGSDTYIFSRGDGADLVTESSGLDSLIFSNNVNANQLWFSRHDQDLEINIIGTSDKVTVENWYVNSDYHVEQIQSSNGKILLDTQVDALVTAMSAYAPPSAGQTQLLIDYQATLNPVIAANWH